MQWMNESVHQSISRGVLVLVRARASATSVCGMACSAAPCGALHLPFNRTNGPGGALQVLHYVVVQSGNLGILRRLVSQVCSRWHGSSEGGAADIAVEIEVAFAPLTRPRNGNKSWAMGNELAPAFQLPVLAHPRPLLPPSVRPPEIRRRAPHVLRSPHVCHQCTPGHSIPLRYRWCTCTRPPLPCGSLRA